MFGGVVGRRVVGSCVAVATLLGCAGAVESSKIEDRARRTVPIPICLKALPRHAAAGVISAMTPEDYWLLIMPSYDAPSSALDANAPDCAGHPVLTDPALAEAEGPSNGLAISPSDLVVSRGPDGFQIVWLRTHHFADGTAAGPLALLRPREAYAEVYAVGLYRGNPATSRFGYERLGPDILVTASNEGCAKVQPGQSCESKMVLFLSRDGLLKPAAEFALDKVQYGQAPSVSGSVQYRLTATPTYQENAVRVTEQIVLRDSGDNEIRRANLQRLWSFKDGDKLVAESESLWTQVVGGARAAGAPEKQPSAAPQQKPRKP